MLLIFVIIILVQWINLDKLSYSNKSTFWKVEQVFKHSYLILYFSKCYGAFLTFYFRYIKNHSVIKTFLQTSYQGAAETETFEICFIHYFIQSYNLYNLAWIHLHLQK